MIKYKTGDLFNEDVEAVVNSVNCVGVMGRGIALQFKKLFPETSKPTRRRANGMRSCPVECSRSRPVK